METPESFSLELLTTYKESSRLEVKSARGGLPNSLWESYSAFANSEGGVIVLGVKENTKNGSLYVEGLDDVHKLMKDFWNTVNNRQKVSSNILTDSMAVPEKLEGKDVIVINVPRAERTSRPVYVGSDPRTGTYRRNFEGDYHCSLEEVSLMIRDSALVTDDNKLLTNIDVSVFCPDTVRSYRNIFKLVRQNHLWNKEDDAMFMRRIGAVREDKDTGKFHPTVAGLLMFGYEYEITAVFPNYSVNCLQMARFFQKVHLLYPVSRAFGICEVLSGRSLGRCSFHNQNGFRIWRYGNWNSRRRSRRGLDSERKAGKATRNRFPRSRARYFGGRYKQPVCLVAEGVCHFRAAQHRPPPNPCAPPSPSGETATQKETEVILTYFKHTKYNKEC